MSPATYNKTRIFVYGTLKKGYSNNRLLKNARYVGQARTFDRFPLRCNGSFPSMFLGGSDRGQVMGEVYEVNDQQLANVDALEGNGNGFYERMEIKLIDEFDREAKAWAYFRDQSAYDTQRRTLEPVFGLLNWGR